MQNKLKINIFLIIFITKKSIGENFEYRNRIKPYTSCSAMYTLTESTKFIEKAKIYALTECY